MYGFNKQFLQFLIAGIAVSMLGVVVIQWYWITNAVDLKNEEFEHDVAIALEKTIQQLEKKETIEKLRSHRQGKFLFFRDDSSSFFDETMPDTSFEYFIIKDLTQQNERLELKVVEENKSKNTTETTIKQIDQIDLLRQMDEGEAQIQLGYNRMFDAPYPVEMEQKQLDSLVRNRLANKKAFVGDIVKSLMEVSLSEDIEARIDPIYLDSMLRLNLSANGVETPHKFGVVNTRNQVKLMNCDKVNEELLETNFRAQLFPNDIIQDPHYLHVFFPEKRAYIFEQLGTLLGLSLLFLGIITYAFYYTINTIFKQKKLSEVKNDFINNMTHELKTPISTISLACEALFDPDIKKHDSMMNRYLHMIDDENKRLRVQVERVLQSAIWEKGSFELSKSRIKLNDIIAQVADKIGIQVEEKGGKIELDLQADKDEILADEVHISNMLYNLLDNANKYAKEQPFIKIKTTSQKNGVTFEVCDNGIGISKENQKKVFDKLYRVPTGNLHDVKGFGLGLSYVKTIVERHGGKIALKSQLNKGSTFKIYIPYEHHGRETENLVG